ncbi:Os10g0544966, partial [Oryza sativa Japonica Group]
MNSRLITIAFSLARMLEESEKTGPRIRRSRGGRPARRMMEPLSRWRVSETPHRSSRIQRRAPAFFFPTLPAPAGDTARGGDGGAGCDADGGGGDGDAGDGELDARGLVSEGRRRAERVRLVEDDVEAFEAKKGSFLPPDRLPMAAAAAATATARSSRAGEKSFGDRRGEGVGPR